MKPRVSDTSLDALLKEGDPAHASKAVTDSERAAFQSLLAALPQMTLPRRRSPLLIIAGFALSALVGLGIWHRLPDPKSVTVANLPSPCVPTPSPCVPTLSPSIPTPSPRVPSPSPRVPTPSPRVPTPFPEPEAVVTHVVIVADSTCRPGDPKPESIVIHGDATSIVTVTTKPEKEKETEVSL